ncbi:hypothetical protein G7K_2700-t1 [Saitoella complicata NRRL Y-17804]|uniref:Uncharacterized protein n=1 Tax=Saitoella complicata (strain BCRC 22490 / CBS 7301 / JCM 7358 / NBRC 10748 / NRRL Y-17804) TaxID=698492 RepID=A0A0E9NF89_SAICN|nr:hypothetical protein G7K_2700-t1 [Saitoella complicata NRRL Y-17804]
MVLGAAGDSGVHGCMPPWESRRRAVQSRCFMIDAEIARQAGIKGSKSSCFRNQTPLISLTNMTASTKPASMSFYNKI